jgi:hypothetical protein
MVRRWFDEKLTNLAHQPAQGPKSEKCPSTWFDDGSMKNSPTKLTNQTHQSSSPTSSGTKFSFVALVGFDHY